MEYGWFISSSHGKVTFLPLAHDRCQGVRKSIMMKRGIHPVQQQTDGNDDIILLNTTTDWSTSLVSRKMKTTSVLKLFVSLHLCASRSRKKMVARSNMFYSYQKRKENASSVLAQRVERMLRKTNINWKKPFRQTRRKNLTNQRWTLPCCFSRPFDYSWPSIQQCFSTQTRVDVCDSADQRESSHF